MQYTYPVRLSEDRDDGGYVVTCRDIPEVITQGDTFNEALEYAADALDVALCGRIDQGGDIPAPTARKAGEHLVCPHYHRAEGGCFRAVSTIWTNQAGYCRRTGIARKRDTAHFKPRTHNWHRQT